MPSWINDKTATFQELTALDAEIIKLAEPRDGTATLLARLSEKYPKTRYQHGKR